MNQSETDLSVYNNSWYKPGRGVITRCCWYVVNTAFIKSSFPVSGLKVFFLRLFGAKIGKGVVVKPGVNVKYPWHLSVGEYSWIGENVWIDNLTAVTIGRNCCISQGGFILTGNHNYKKKEFDLIVKPVVLEDGSWVGAQAVVCPGVRMKTHALLTVGSVAVQDLEPWSIYQGNPAVKVRDRVKEKN